jgi:uncharacterized membrane protein
VSKLKMVLRFVVSMKWMIFYVYVISLMEVFTGKFSLRLHTVAIWFIVILGTSFLIGYLSSWGSGEDIHDKSKD